MLKLLAVRILAYTHAMLDRHATDRMYADK